MSTSFDADLFTVGELQADKKVLVVPAYQRPFCWTDKQIEVLVQDLITHFARYSKDKTRLAAILWVRSFAISEKLSRFWTASNA